jgi:hypothetical protein
MPALDKNAPGDDALSASLVQWRVHLSKRHPHKLKGIVVACVLACVMALTFFGSALIAFAAVALVVLSASEFLLPIRYEVSNESARVRYGLVDVSVPWSRVRRVLVGDEGIRLSLFPTDCRLDAFRGITMRYADGSPKQEELLALANARMASAQQIQAIEQPSSEACGHV